MNDLALRNSSRSVLFILLTLSCGLSLTFSTRSAFAETPLNPQSAPSNAMVRSDDQRMNEPRIQAFSVEEVKRLAPGVDLNFSMYGTPGGQASLRIAGAIRNLTLIEIGAGEYEGTYTISAKDKIAARSQVTANLRVGNQITSEVLSESLQTGIGYHPKNQGANNLQIQHFSLDAPDELSAGNTLSFRLQANPNARVELTIAGVRGKVLLSETSQGEYVGDYLIRSRDRILPNSEVIAYVILQNRSISQRLGQSLLDKNSRSQANRSDNKRPVIPKVVCYNCGQVEAINVIETRGEGGYLGTIGGGVVGALLGSQIGGGNGRTAAQIAGAVGGAYAGRAIEGNSRKSRHFEVRVRLNNGATQTLGFANDPGLKVGDKVKIDNGRLVRTP